MANIEQLQNQVQRYRDDIERIDGQIELLNKQIETLNDKKDRIRDDIGKITGSKNEQITTTSVGNISQYGGKGNYSPKIGTILTRNRHVKYLDKFGGVSEN